MIWLTSATFQHASQESNTNEVAATAATTAPSPPDKRLQTTLLHAPEAAQADSQRKIRFAPLTRQHLSQYEQWINDAPSAHYFIQLLATYCLQDKLGSVPDHAYVGFLNTLNEHKDVITEEVVKLYAQQYKDDYFTGLLWDKAKSPLPASRK